MVKWVPVKSEWPKKRGRYLTTYREWSNGDYLPKYDDTYVRILSFDEAIFRFPKCIDRKAEADTHREVIAWMPLPEPYKDEEALNGECGYCKSILESTPASPRRKYRYCPMCGRLRR